MYQRSWSAAPVRSHSMAYVWNAAWHVVRLQAAPPFCALWFVAGAAPGAGDAAVQDVVGPVQPLDVLHDVELADPWPGPPVGAIGAAEHPEGRPVAHCLCPGDIRHLHATFNTHDAAREGLEVGALGFHPRGGPGTGAVTLRRDDKASVRDVHVGGVVGQCLDLSGAEGRRTTGIRRSERELPICRVGKSGTAEVVPESRGPGGSGGGDGGDGCDDECPCGDADCEGHGEQCGTCGHHCPSGNTR